MRERGGTSREEKNIIWDEMEIRKRGKDTKMRAKSDVSQETQGQGTQRKFSVGIFNFHTIPHPNPDPSQKIK